MDRETDCRRLAVYCELGGSWPISERDIEEEDVEVVDLLILFVENMGVG